ncbi:malto-oligosyltrehalose trehalohydrolase [Sesbania bispinosa]|nr:malto-oligosyltrehalose trehalohydrolase [Sesbania bispinosa]
METRCARGGAGYCDDARVARERGRRRGDLRGGLRERWHGCAKVLPLKREMMAGLIAEMGGGSETESLPAVSHTAGG